MLDVVNDKNINPTYTIFSILFFAGFIFILLCYCLKRFLLDAQTRRKLKKLSNKMLKLVYVLREQIKKIFTLLHAI